MTDTDDFHAHYIAALQTYLDARDEDSLAVGHELGRRALQEQISMLEIIEHTFGGLLKSISTRQSTGRRPWNSYCRRSPHSMSQLGDSWTAPSVTRNSGPAPTFWPIATNSAPPW